jgi:hypothetical protein
MGVSLLVIYASLVDHLGDDELESIVFDELVIVAILRRGRSLPPWRAKSSFRGG